MKKNITINMQGRLYAIDEDAYNLLKQYEDSLRNYFANKEGGHEIVDDIEARIAELFDEVVARGKVAIDINDVESIVTRMGAPRDMDEPQDEGADENGSDGNPNEQENGTQTNARTAFETLKRFIFRSDRRLYRDIANKKVSGVMAGLAHYYGGDVTWWRIGALVIPLLFMMWHMPQVMFGMVVAYFILVITLPPAFSPADRLQMNGRDVNPQNLAEEVTADNASQMQQQPNTRPGCVGALGEIIIFGIKLVMFLVAAAIITGCFWLLVMLLLLLFAPTLVMFESQGLAFPWTEHPWVGTIGVVSVAMFIVLAIYGLMSIWRSHRNQQSGLSAGSRWALALLLLASLTGVMTCGTIIVNNLIEQSDRFTDTLHNQHVKSHTHNGFYVDDDEWEYLTNNGWTIKQGAHCHDRYTKRGDYYTGNSHRRYLDCYDENGQQLYQVERTDSLLEKGSYTLTAVVRADGPGAYIYAIADGKTYKVEIPAEGNTGGTLWQEAKATKNLMEADSTKLGGNNRLVQIAEANDGNGYGWCTVSIKGIHSKSGRISYGLTTVPSITKNQFYGTWFSATDFHLAKQ